MKIYTCPYCGDELDITYDVFGLMLIKCHRCTKKANKMRKNGLTDEEIIKIFGGLNE